MLNKCNSFLTGTIMAVLLIGFLIVPKSAFSECDADEPPGFTCEPWTDVSVTRTFPITFGCTVTFKYQKRECTDFTSCQVPKTIIQYRFASISMHGTCYNLNGMLFPGYPNNFGVMNEAYFNELIDGIFLQLGKERFELDPINAPNCPGTPPNCTAPTNPCEQLFMASYSLPKCRAYCIRAPHASSFGEVTVVMLECPTALSIACCEHKKFFCKCGGVTMVTEVNSYTQGNCNPLMEPTHLCQPLEGMPPPSYINCGSSCE
jgi:hypothetical protein